MDLIALFVLIVIIAALIFVFAVVIYVLHYFFGLSDGMSAILIFLIFTIP